MTGLCPAEEEKRFCDRRIGRATVESRRNFSGFFAEFAEAIAKMPHK